MSDAKLAHDFVGHDVFDDGPGPAPAAMHSMKSAHLKGHDVFDDSPDDAARRTGGRQFLDVKLADDFVGHDVFGDVATPRRPSTALSELKRHEMIGQNTSRMARMRGTARTPSGRCSSPTRARRLWRG